MLSRVAVANEPLLFDIIVHIKILLSDQPSRCGGWRKRLLTNLADMAQLEKYEIASPVVLEAVSLSVHA